MSNAKAGDKIAARARRALARAYGHGFPLASVETEVAPKSDGDRGQWVCVDCGHLPQNNMGARSHEIDKPKHRMAWRSFVSGKIEAP